MMRGAALALVLLSQEAHGRAREDEGEELLHNRHFGIRNEGCVALKLRNEDSNQCLEQLFPTRRLGQGMSGRPRTENNRQVVEAYSTGRDWIEGMGIGGR